MKEKILGSVVMGVTSNEGVTKEKTIEVVRDPGMDSSMFRSRTLVSNNLDLDFLDHGPFSVQALRHELEKNIEDGYQIRKVNDEMSSAEMSIDFVLGRLHIGFMNEVDWMEFLFGHKKYPHVTFEPGQVAPLW